MSTRDSCFRKEYSFPGSSTVKNLPTKQKTQVRSLGREDSLEKEMATHTSILAWKIPETEEPGRLQSIRSQRVWHNWSDLAHTQALANSCLPTLSIIISGDFKSNRVLVCWFSTTSSSVITASTSPQVMSVILSLPTATNAAIPFSCKLPTFHHCLYLSCSSLVIPNFNSSTSPRHTIQWVYHRFCSSPHTWPHFPTWSG